MKSVAITIVEPHHEVKDPLELSKAHQHSGFLKGMAKENFGYYHNPPSHFYQPAIKKKALEKNHRF